MDDHCRQASRAFSTTQWGGTSKMDGFYPSTWSARDSWAPTLAHDLLEPVRNRVAAGPHHPAEFAARLYACEALKPPSGTYRADEVAEPYTLQWFLDIESQRHGRQGRWIPRLLEFAKHPGERLLGLGHGLGTDWLQYARHGASVVVCSPSAEQLTLIQRNFELRGLRGLFLPSAFHALPLESASIDVACVNSLLDEVERPEDVIAEVYRVLKPGGKVLAVTAARYDVDYWTNAFFPWKRWFTREPRPQLARVPFSRQGLCRLFERYVEPKIYKRHLRRSEVPHVWRWAPMPVLERLMGRVLVFKAFKPLSAAKMMLTVAA
jgi:ubiquinone/menaquinone biosynthesis C-methylase UbiE